VQPFNKFVSHGFSCTTGTLPKSSREIKPTVLNLEIAGTSISKFIRYNYHSLTAKIFAVARPQTPPVAADCIIEVGNRIVLIERRYQPFGWALPGGFVEFGETVEQAAIREAREETSMEVELRALLGVYSRPDRDPRGQSITVVYVGTAPGVPRAADDAQNAVLFEPDRLPTPLAFDHAEILADYLHFIRTGEYPAPWLRR
jgi:8-oxo-dGTP diphosphatase